jgi:hypothetical protein
MTRVIIHTRDADNAFISRWQCGSRSGEVTTAAPRGPQPRVQAELHALSHLIVHKKLVGLDNGVLPLTFCVSEPAVVQAVQNPSANPELRLRSRALRARFGDAVFEACEMPPPLLPGSELSLLAADRPIDWTAMLDGALVVVTEHAVKQVQQRHAFKNRGYAYRFIQRWAKRRMNVAALPAAVTAEKLSKYATPGVIKCDDTGWHGVIVNQTLVTMFYRDTRN